ncbi:uncharacterized protein LOC126249551 [Schistocerca nitens]|uniref:uncharacterized protein LOC126249551 n=1 Tax=Schistocerca nitens TaxID=7011 RepID=UPI0021184638|nr:uncharacterized protein LOC126249551 [Schistocerca nitens]
MATKMGSVLNMVNLDRSLVFGNGESHKSLAFRHRISVPSISQIVVLVCTAMRNVLKDNDLKAPTTEGKWKTTADTFDELWRTLHCLGAMEGKYVAFAADQQAHFIIITRNLITL